MSAVDVVKGSKLDYFVFILFLKNVNMHSSSKFWKDSYIWYDEFTSDIFLFNSNIWNFSYVGMYSSHIIQFWMPNKQKINDKNKVNRFEKWKHKTSCQKKKKRNYY